LAGEQPDFTSQPDDAFISTAWLRRQFGPMGQEMEPLEALDASHKHGLRNLHQVTSVLDSKSSCYSMG